MLNQLKTIRDKKDEYFRNDLMRMLMFMKLNQFMIKVLQESPTVTENTEYKQLKRFSQEVYQKIEWFITVIKKMAGDNAMIIDSEVSFDNDKINDLAQLADFILTHTDKDISDAVDLVTNRVRREELLFCSWKNSRLLLSPDINVNKTDFDKWYADKFPA